MFGVRTYHRAYAIHFFSSTVSRLSPTFFLSSSVGLFSRGVHDSIVLISGRRLTSNRQIAFLEVGEVGEEW